MLVTEYYNCLNAAQQQVVLTVRNEATKSVATANACQSVRMTFAKAAQDLFSYQDLQRIKMGIEPDWGTVDIDWDAAFDVFILSKPPLPLPIRVISKVLGIDTMIINFVFGLNLDKNIDKETELLVNKAIWIAAILEG